MKSSSILGPYYKLEGTGNDFVFVESSVWNLVASQFEIKSIIKKMCSRKKGIGADGIVVVDKEKSTWKYWNSDGSEARFCGNASRCVVVFLDFLSEEKVTAKTYEFSGEIGTIKGSSMGSNIKVLLNLSLSGEWVNINNESFYKIDSGVPHLVKVLENQTDLNLENYTKWARGVQKIQSEYKHGTNVTLVWGVEDSGIKACSFERGVEDWTLACGSGAIAAAHAISIGSKVQSSEILVTMPGGVLEIGFNEHNKKEQSVVSLKGEVHFVGQFNLDESFFNEKKL